MSWTTITKPKLKIFQEVTQLMLDCLTEHIPDSTLSYTRLAFENVLFAFVT